MSSTDLLMASFMTYLPYFLSPTVAVDEECMILVPLDDDIFPGFAAHATFQLPIR